MTQEETRRLLKLYNEHHDQIVKLLTQILTEIKQK
jgi:hypothetical protein|tara:strand:- start:142 stop:246 length:105 start_codon:yes stop_codon:yes gene_type:complete